ncbi:MAG: CehA/McbA family metallohydrolase [Candidatus Tectomicrobia bacterium]|nr:CehA/McbA family metallohydrolase [Candidatus Tectomicrobia bacterium]
MHYHFEGSLTARDCKRHIPHQFVVPANSGQMDIHLRFAPHGVHNITNMLTLAVFDLGGFRGAGHRDGASHRVHIGVIEATPGYLPGPLPAGEWIAQIDTHMIMPGEAVYYWLDVTITEETSKGIETKVLRKARFRKIPQRGAGWYRGDLHSHTHHSDAGERTVAELIQTARDYRLDFIFLTDHNTTAGLDEMDASATGDLLTAGGVELTTFWGHALCLGTRAWVDWRVRPGTGDIARLATTTYANDQVFIIAHPQATGDPACTGCAWRYGEMMPGSARLIEIWNGPWGGDSNNAEALSLWYDWLNQGLCLVATAGTDTHSTQDYAAKPGFNVAYAEALSEAALLKALRAGHLYLSADPRVTFEARSESGERWIIGDTVTKPVTFTVIWANCPDDAQIRLIVNGRLLNQWMGGAHGEYEWNMTPDQADWVVVEIRGGNGGLLAITNPIFLQQNKELSRPG